MNAAEPPRLDWTEALVARSARWRSEAGIPPHRNIVIADDTLSADAAYRQATAGTAMLWRGDWQNARKLLQALTRRAERKPRSGSVAQENARPPQDSLTPSGDLRGEARPWGSSDADSNADAFARHRQNQGRRAGLLGMLLVPLDGDYKVPLRRAQDVRQACIEAYGPIGEDSVVSLRELLAVISAHEWRKKGVPVAAIAGSIHPHYGVFSPVRGEYVELVANAPLPAALVACRSAPLPAASSRAVDVGTGSGILAIVLARRGITRVVATDCDPRALQCARDNCAQLGWSATIEVIEADLFAPGRAALVVCNPPWLPAQPSAPIEYAIYDPESRMLRGFLAGLAAHLEDGGEGWLILSDFAEHLGLRSRRQLLDWIAAGGLHVIARLDTRPTHAKAADRSDPLHAARAAEVTSLWRLGANKDSSPESAARH